jgi:hypothetical protein
MVPQMVKQVVLQLVVQDRQVEELLVQLVVIQEHYLGKLVIKETKE